MTIKAIKIKNSKYQNNFAKFSISKALTTLMATTALGCGLPASDSFAAEFMFKPSVGIDVGVRSMQFHELYGKGHFADRYHYVSPYVHVQILEHLGVQAGLETSDTRKTLKQYAMDEPVLGNPDYAALNDINTLSFAKLKSEFLGLTINSSTFFKQYNMPTQLSLFAGISMTKMRLSFVNLTDANMGIHPLTEQTTIINSPKKAIPKIMFSLKFLIPQNNNISLKISYGWEKTSSITIQQKDTLTASHFLIKPHNSNLITIGCMYSI